VASFKKNSFVTQKDIARLANVSQSAVAATLGQSDKIRVSEQTRARILKAVSQLNYTPNRFASITRSGRSHNIAVLAYGTMLQSVFHRLRHLALLLKEHGFAAVPHELEWTNCTLDQGWDEALAARSEGIILASSFGVIPPSVHRKILNSPVPTISMCGPVIAGIPLLAPDLRTSFRELTGRLLQSGLRDLVLLKSRGREDAGTHVDWKRAVRVEGFLDAAREYGAEKSCSIVEVEQNETDRPTLEHELGEKGLARILEGRGGHPPQAVVCFNDNFALGVVSESIRRGVKIPKEMAVTGCDGEDWTGYGAIPITTIIQPAEAIARKTFELLMAMLAGETPIEEQTMLPCEITWRTSCPHPVSAKKPAPPRPSKKVR